MTPEARAALHALAFTLPRPWHAEEFRSLAAAPGIFACDRAGGFAIGRDLRGEAELLTLAVHPAARRRGIGAGLLAAFEAEARRRGAARAVLEVAATNIAARALYARAGYARAGLRPGYFRDHGGAPVDALILARRLEDAQPEGA